MPVIVCEKEQPKAVVGIKTETQGRSKPMSREDLYDEGGEDLSVQNSALFYAHELLMAAQLDQRMSACNVHVVWQRQACDLLHAFALADDKSFYKQMCEDPHEFPFPLRFAWLWCRFADCDQDEINPFFPTGRGFVEETVAGHCAGVASSKQEIADVLLQLGPFRYVDRARNLVDAAAKAARRHAEPILKRAKTVAFAELSLSV